MKIDKAYNTWAGSYDIDENKTRDLEKNAACYTLSKFEFRNVLELGCGTGKNTEWIAEKAESIIALDFSEEMLARAKKKIHSAKVLFCRADINQNWNISNKSVNLISCSLTLEHVQNLNFVFQEARDKLKTKGLFFICELHPFKQYSGSKARFDMGEKTIELQVFTHHVSDYLDAARENGFNLLELKEWFDDGDRSKIPRLISFVFEKNRLASPGNHPE